ncbi:MAG TPA: glycosyltransferase family 4 protein [Thermoanaerobaculia bacterium]|nr:glycosyltransferase family 4 protein [Thermoanaerobaculia bacterium]
MIASTVQPLAQSPRPPAPSPATVLLGPHIDLHHGYHGSLRADPPEAIEIHARGGEHVFCFTEPVAAGDRFAPFERPHLGELIDLGPGPQVVHSPRWPVVRRRAWTVDLDDLGYPALLGRHVFGETFRDPERDPWSERERSVAVRRFLNLMTAYAHPSCRAVFFWTREASRQAKAGAARHVPAPLAERVWAKSHVLYPAQRAIRRSLVVDKWRRPEPLRLVFVGNDHRVKQGELALAVFERLAEELPAIRCSYAGALPDALRARAVRTTVLGEVPRRRLLDLFGEAHVLFHPSTSESFGMALLEAAAHGMAVVVGGGSGMRHLEEIFRPGEACVVPRAGDGSRDREAHAFVEALRRLAIDPERAREVALAGHRRVADGPFAPEARNAVLAEVWRSAQAEPSPPPLLPEDLPHWDPTHRWRIGSAELAGAIRDYTSEKGIDRRNFYFRAW